MCVDEGRTNLFYSQSYVGPCRGEQDQNHQLSAGKVLLVLHILIGGNEDFLPFLLGLLNQVSIIQVGPASLRDSDSNVDEGSDGDDDCH